MYHDGTRPVQPPKGRAPKHFIGDEIRIYVLLRQLFNVNNYVFVGYIEPNTRRLHIKG